MRRKDAALSQGELADLLSISQSSISRLEDGSDPPTLETVFGLQVIFDMSPRQMFAAFYTKVEDAVMRRAAILDGKIRGKTDAASVKQQRLLTSMVNRATSNAKEV